MSERLELRKPKSSHDIIQFFSGQATYKVPTTDAANVELDISPPPAYPYQCSAETGELCQFPYGLKGEDTVHWNCARRSTKCSPTSNDATASWTNTNKLRFFESKADFHECAACNWTQIPCVIPGLVFSGFGLSSYAGIYLNEIANLAAPVVIKVAQLRCEKVGRLSGALPVG